MIDSNSYQKDWSYLFSFQILGIKLNFVKIKLGIIYFTHKKTITQQVNFLLIQLFFYKIIKPAKKVKITTKH